MKPCNGSILMAVTPAAGSREPHAGHRLLFAGPRIAGGLLADGPSPTPWDPPKRLASAPTRIAHGPTPPGGRESTLR